MCSVKKSLRKLTDDALRTDYKNGFQKKTAKFSDKVFINRTITGRVLIMMKLMKVIYIIN